MLTRLTGKSKDMRTTRYVRNAKVRSFSCISMSTSTASPTTFSPTVLRATRLESATATSKSVTPMMMFGKLTPTNAPPWKINQRKRKTYENPLLQYPLRHRWAEGQRIAQGNYLRQHRLGKQRPL